MHSSLSMNASSINSFWNKIKLTSERFRVLNATFIRMTIYRKGQTAQDNPFSLASSECSSPLHYFFKWKTNLSLANFQSAFELASWPDSDPIRIVGQDTKHYSFFVFWRRKKKIVSYIEIHSKRPFVVTTRNLTVLLTRENCHSFAFLRQFLVKVLLHETIRNDDF